MGDEEPSLPAVPQQRPLLPRGCEMLCENVFDGDGDPSDSDELILKRREPTMVRKGKKLVAPPIVNDKKKYTLVLDLDETLVYARDGPLYARAYLKDFLRAIKDTFEVIVWTAGEREYAKNVLEEINEELIIQHLIYRHRNWFNEEDYTKDLKQLGRDMNYTIIVENTPDCVRANPENGIIVADFEVAPPESESVSPTPQAGEADVANAGAGACSSSFTGEATPTDQTIIETPSLDTDGNNAPLTSRKRKRASTDRTLYLLQELLTSLAEAGSTVPAFLKSCELLSRQTVEMSDGKEVPIYYLGTRRRRRDSNGKKEVRENRDKGSHVKSEQHDVQGPESKPSGRVSKHD